MGSSNEHLRRAVRFSADFAMSKEGQRVLAEHFLASQDAFGTTPFWSEEFPIGHTSDRFSHPKRRDLYGSNLRRC